MNGHNYLYDVKYVLIAILLYIVYQLIFKLGIPVYRAIKEVKQKFREMHSQMKEPYSCRQDYSPGYAGAKKDKNEHAGEYIDFEEVK